MNASAQRLKPLTSLPLLPPRTAPPGEVRPIHPPDRQRILSQLPADWSDLAPLTILPRIALLHPKTPTQDTFFLRYTGVSEVLTDHVRVWIQGRSAHEGRVELWGSPQARDQRLVIEFYVDNVDPIVERPLINLAEQTFRVSTGAAVEAFTIRCPGAVLFAVEQSRGTWLQVTLSSPLAWSFEAAQVWAF